MERAAIHQAYAAMLFSALVLVFSLATLPAVAWEQVRQTQPPQAESTAGEDKKEPNAKPNDAKPNDAKPNDAKPKIAPEGFAERLKVMVPKLRTENGLVGLGAMIMVDGAVVAATVDGERKKGSGVALEVGDRWHLGSITKSMTSTMIARLIERKQIDWKTTVGECLGESIEVHADWRDVTLEQLLTHTSGAPANFSFTTNLLRPPEGQPRVAARLKAVASILKTKPPRKPGDAFAYSNVGYAIAAAMVEAKTNDPWEDLIRREIFAPLKAKMAGFGPPKDKTKPLEQPRGHQNIGPFKRAVGVEDDNSPIIGPAGSVHMTLGELCAYGNEHLLGEGGHGKLLSAKTYLRLHTPKLKRYAFGWVVPERDKKTNQRIVWHNGSNTMWYALLVLAPDRKTVFGVTSNDGNIKRAEAVGFRIVKEFSLAP